MTNMTRTLIYVGVAVITVSLAVWKGLPTTEINPQDFANVGQEFYPDYVDPTVATGIRVVVYDEQLAEGKSFEVKNQNNEWKIPSHYSYPADGKEQLAKTAASLVAVKRGAVAGESELDFERLGVVDPLSQDKAKSRGRGERLTLTQGNHVLVDLIIGKPVENQNGFYYVRKPDEKLTYIAELEIDLSTKFGDWIEPDLLQIDPAQVREIVIKDYSIDEASRRIVFNDVLQLQRPDANSDWTLEELDAAKEELKTADVNTMVTALDELKIVGVRPKPAGLSSDLKLAGGLSGDSLSLLDLQSKGYYVVPTSSGGAELYSNEGDLAVMAADGVAYVLRFGEVFTGNEFDIEVGSAKSETDEAQEAATEEAETEAAAEEVSGTKRSRYLFVTVQFNPEALGPAPEKPTAPAEPAEADPATENAEENAEASDAAAEQTEKPADPQETYQNNLKKYEADLAAYNKRLEAGEKRVAELNARFADWYYVIDAASFDKIHKSRKDLVTEKAPAETPENPAAAEPATPAESAPAENEDPAMSAPAEKTSAPTESAPANPAPATPEQTQPMPVMEKPAEKPAATPEEPKSAEPQPMPEPATPESSAPKTEPKPAEPQPEAKPEAETKPEPSSETPAGETTTPESSPAPAAETPGSETP